MTTTATDATSRLLRSGVDNGGQRSRAISHGNPIDYGLAEEITL